MQDALGGLNDLETRHGLMSGGAGATGVETKTAIPDPAKEDAARERLLAAAEQAFARFARAESFWRT